MTFPLHGDPEWDKSCIVWVKDSSMIRQDSSATRNDSSRIYEIHNSDTLLASVFTVRILIFSLDTRRTILVSVYILEIQIVLALKRFYWHRKPFSKIRIKANYVLPMFILVRLLRSIVLKHLDSACPHADQWRNLYIGTLPISCSYNWQSRIRILIIDQWSTNYLPYALCP